MSSSPNTEKFSIYRFEKQVKCTSCKVEYEQWFVEVCNLCRDVVCKECIQQGRWVVDECGWINVHKPEKGNLECKEYENAHEVFSGGELYYTCSDECFKELVEECLSDRTLAQLGLTDC